MGFLETALRACLVVLPAVALVGAANAAAASENSNLPDYPLTDRDLEIGGGYFDSRGWYAGGIPELGGESETYDICQELITPDDAEKNGTSSTMLVDMAGTMCSVWIANKPKIPAEGDQLDWCRCMFNNEYYCEEWACSRMLVEALEYCDGEAPDDDDFPFRRERRMADCTQFISHDSSRCYCEKAHKESRRFCPMWTCDTYLEDVMLKETVECLTASDNGLYCKTWSGTVSGDEYFGTTACACSAQSAGPTGICAISACKEKGIEKCTVCKLTTSVAGFGIAGMLGVLMLASRCNAGEWRSAGVVLGIIWMLGASAGAAVYGGVMGSIYVAIMWVGTVIFYLICCRAPKEEKHHRKPLASVNR